MPKSRTYEEFVDKFKPKKTTDDCYTPPEVYEAVKGFVCSEYGVNEADIVRPFWPGADYQAEIYSDGCVVVDNPPFSILSKIVDWFLEREIKFFLFAPSLTVFSGGSSLKRVNHLICDASITYENGAKVKTSFVTNLEFDGVIAQTHPKLCAIIDAAVSGKNNLKRQPAYAYPDNIVTAALMQRYCRRGIEFAVRAEECELVRGLDEQKPSKKAIFGGGLLLSTAAALRKGAAEKDSIEPIEPIEPIKWNLSARERAIVEELDKGAAKC